jgi:hypothetical protein
VIRHVSIAATFNSVTKELSSFNLDGLEENSQAQKRAILICFELPFRSH